MDLFGLARSPLGHEIANTVAALTVVLFLLVEEYLNTTLDARTYLPVSLDIARKDRYHS